MIPIQQENKDFPFAPYDWTQEEAQQAAADDGLEATDSHWDAVRALQEFYARHGEDQVINVRQLHDALDERFHAQGGMKYLYRLFPGGPVSQGCRLAGLKAPAGSSDSGFGSVQ